MAHHSQRGIWMVIAVLVSGLWGAWASAGMPAPLPSDWTAENTPDWAERNLTTDSKATALRVQAISFFLAVLLASGWVVKKLWNIARRDFPKLPELSYSRALGLVGLWGLSFVIVLTMISGARELMTPGAWRKQGWTYKLANDTPPNLTAGRAARQQQLEKLRTALWQYAATHDGRLPQSDELDMESGLWSIPGWPGLNYLAVPERRAETIGRLYVFEPELEGNERLVLLTNGFIGTMSSTAITHSLTDIRKVPAAAGTEPKLSAPAPVESVIHGGDPALPTGDPHE